MAASSKPKRPIAKPVAAKPAAAKPMNAKRADRPSPGKSSSKPTPASKSKAAAATGTRKMPAALKPAPGKSPLTKPAIAKSQASKSTPAKAATAKTGSSKSSAGTASKPLAATSKKPQIVVKPGALKATAAQTKAPAPKGPASKASSGKAASGSANGKAASTTAAAGGSGGSTAAAGGGAVASTAGGAEAKKGPKGITIVNPKQMRKPKLKVKLEMPVTEPLLRPGAKWKPLIQSGPKAPPSQHGAWKSPEAIAAAEVKIDPKARLPKKDLDKYREILLRKRAELLGDITTIEEEALRTSSGSLSTLPQHMAEQGSDTFEQHLSLDIAAVDRTLLREIEAAIKRIDDGTYGVCMKTGKRISADRLAEIPWAKYSIEAAREMERHPQPRTSSSASASASSSSSSSDGD